MGFLSEVYTKGGAFFIVNTVILAIVVGLIIERAIYFLGRGHLNANALYDQIRKLLVGGSIERAKRLCESDDAKHAAVAQVALAGLSKAHRGEAAVAQAIEERMTEALPAVKTRIGALWSLANIATLTGLVGTVVGLIRTFNAIANASAAERSAALSHGIAEAMYNTAFGLFIALVCTVAHLILSAAMKRVIADLEHFVLRFENLLGDDSGASVTGKPSHADTASH